MESDLFVRSPEGSYVECTNRNAKEAHTDNA